MRREGAAALIFDTVLAELRDRQVPGDRDEAWREVAGNAIDGLNAAAELLRYARAISVEVSQAITPRMRLLAETKMNFARLRAWRASAAVVAALLAAQGDHPFTEEQPDYTGSVPLQ